MGRKWVLCFLGVLLLGGLLLFQAPPRIGAEENLHEQIAKILRNQEKILQDLGEIKKELTRIRIRAN